MLVLIMFFLKSMAAGPAVDWRVHVFGLAGHRRPARRRPSSRCAAGSRRTRRTTSTRTSRTGCSSSCSSSSPRPASCSSSCTAPASTWRPTSPTSCTCMAVVPDARARGAVQQVVAPRLPAAGDVLRRGARRRPPPPAKPSPRRSARPRPPEGGLAWTSERIGVYVCNCGTNIAKVVDCDAVVESAAALPGVAVARPYKYMCSNPGQEMIVGRHQGARPRTGWSWRPAARACTSRRSARHWQKAGLNPYFLEMANIREQCSWVHDDRVDGDREGEGARHAAAVLRVAHHEPLERRSVDMCPNALVIGGGIAGMTAALDLADAGSTRLPRRARPTTSAATSHASTSPRRTSTPRATCSPSASRASSSTRNIDVFSTAQVGIGRRLRRQLPGVARRQRRRPAASARPRRSTSAASSSAPATRSSTPAGSPTTATASCPTSSRRSSSSRCCARGRVETKEGKAAAVRGHRPLRRQPQPRVPRLLLARVLHDGAEVRARGQVGGARGLRQRHLHRHARLRQGPRGLLPAQLRGQDALPHVREERLPGHPQGRRPRTTARC